MIETTLDDFLLNYRNSPHASTGKAPAEVLMGRRLKDVLTLIALPEVGKTTTILNRQTSQQVEADRGKRKVQFNTNDRVMVRDFSNPNKHKWQPATVVGVKGAKHYTCELISGQIRLCHADQMIPASTDETHVSLEQRIKNQPLKSWNNQQPKLMVPELESNTSLPLTNYATNESDIEYQSVTSEFPELDDKGTESSKDLTLATT